METPVTIRRFKNAAATFCVVAAACVVILWMRSFVWADKIEVRSPGKFLIVNSVCGRLILVRDDEINITETEKQIRSTRAAGDDISVLRDSSFLGFLWFVNRPAVAGVMIPNWVMIPHWAIFCVFAGLGAALTIRRPYRITLRGLLIGTAVIAGALACGLLCSRYPLPDWRY